MIVSLTNLQELYLSSNKIVNVPFWFEMEMENKNFYY